MQVLFTSYPKYEGEDGQDATQICLLISAYRSSGHELRQD